MSRRVAGLLLIILGVIALAAEVQQPYSGQHVRTLKALAAEEIHALLAGDGMGLAKAAELNHYPGPKHVLELREQLGLSDEQCSATQQVFDGMRSRAQVLGRRIVEREEELDALFATRRADEQVVAARVAEIAALQGELRAAHLEAHLKMRGLLRDEQVLRYDRLRGYGEGAGHAH